MPGREIPSARSPSRCKHSLLLPQNRPGNTESNSGKGAWQSRTKIEPITISSGIHAGRKPCQRPINRTQTTRSSEARLTEGASSKKIRRWPDSLRRLAQDSEIRASSLIAASPLSERYPSVSSPRSSCKLFGVDRSPDYQACRS